MKHSSKHHQHTKSKSRNTRGPRATEEEEELIEKKPEKTFWLSQVASAEGDLHFRDLMEDEGFNLDSLKLVGLMKISEI